jgi:two-component system OmpR family response regulator
MAIQLVDRGARPGRPPAGAEQPRVLIIDDEEPVRAGLPRALAAEGLAADLAPTGQDGLRRALGGQYDLVILELMVPGMDGRAVLRELMRRKPWQTVLVLSRLADVRSKVDCFDLGARDYLTKPFSPAELLARVRNQLRGNQLDEIVRVGNLRVHVGRMEADIGRGLLPLTRLEFLVLRELMGNVGQSVSRGQLLASVWGYETDPGSNVVGVCVRRIRAKLGNHVIKTVRGEGYQLVPG